MKTGLPRHLTVTDMPSSIPDRSTSVEASASVSADGFMLSISGQTAIAVPTTVVAPVRR